jgi:regulator of sirC expression with transglutaminase-like and TPR domain
MDFTTNDPQNNEQPQSLHWSKDRLHADVQRAVGGPLNLIRELSLVSFHFHPAIEADWIVKRIKFLSYDLHSLFKNDTEAAERLAILNRFFFETEKFQCASRDSACNLSGETAGALQLHRVLSTRKGAPTVLALLYSFLAETIGVQLDFIDLKPSCFLKWCTDGKARFIDMTRAGSTISKDELIESMHSRFSRPEFSHTTLLDIYSFDSYLCDYLLDLRESLEVTIDPEHLLYLQNLLISYQPSNLHLVGERALLHRRIGNFKSALADLKRYFAFNDKLRAPAELVRLNEELIELIDRSKS